jgi:hypothetical protein
MMMTIKLNNFSPDNQVTFNLMNKFSMSPSLNLNLVKLNKTNHNLQRK